MNISKLMTFIFRNRTIFWDILKWNKGQTKWDGGSSYIYNIFKINLKQDVIITGKKII